jgi:hypothetical protein
MDDNNLWRPGASEKLGCRTRGRVNRYYILGGINEEDLPLTVVVLPYFCWHPPTLVGTKLRHIAQKSWHLPVGVSLSIDVMKKASNFSSKVLKVFYFVEPSYCFRSREHPFIRRIAYPSKSNLATLFNWRRPVLWCKSAPHTGSYHCWFRCNDEFLRSAW